MNLSVFHKKPLRKASGEKIKILFVIDKLVPAGTQKNLLEIISRMNRQRFEPHLAVFNLGPEADWFTARAGVKPVLFPVHRAYDATGWKAFRGLCEWMRRERFDWVQLHFLQAEMLALPAARLFGKGTRIVITRRDEGFWRSGRQLALSRFFAACSDAVLCNSEAVRRAVLTREHVPSDRTGVLYNGVDTELFRPDEALREKTRRGLGVETGQVLVGTVSNMRYEVKGYRFLIEAAAKVCAVHPGVRFLFAGDGALRPDYEALAERLGVRSRLIFAGVRQDIPALLNACDIVCQPSLSEGFSNTLLEAMACAKAVVVTSVGGNTEVVDHGVSGLLVPPSDADAIADAVRALVENAEKRRALGGEALKKITACFSMQAMVAGYEAFYSGGLQG